MNKVTRRMKQDAAKLMGSRLLNDSIAFRFLGWAEAAVAGEISNKGKTVGAMMVEFVKANSSEIRKCPLRK